MFIQQMFAECWVCEAGRESQASAAGAGGQEAQEREGTALGGGLSVAASARWASLSLRGQMRAMTFIQKVMEARLGNGRIKAVFVEDWPACVLAEDYSDRMSGGGDGNISFTRQGKVWLPEVSDVIDTTCRGADLHVSLTGLACLRGGRELGRGLGNFSGTPGTREQSLLFLQSLPRSA